MAHAHNPSTLGAALLVEKIQKETLLEANLLYIKTKTKQKTTTKPHKPKRLSFPPSNPEYLQILTPLNNGKRFHFRLLEV